LPVAFAVARKRPIAAEISWRETGKQKEESIQKYITV